MKAFQITWQIDVFYYTRVFRKKEKKSENEFLDLWVSKQFLKTEQVRRLPPPKTPQGAQRERLTPK